MRRLGLPFLVPGWAGTAFPLLAAGLACIALFPGVSIGAEEARPRSEGIFTEAQAVRGRSLFFSNCAACHGGALQGEEGIPALTGKRFFDRWGGRPANMLYGYIDTQMPLGQPGSLGAQGTADVMAYILSVNKLPPGTRELPSDAGLLKAIAIGSAP